MAIDKNPIFEWLRLECASIRSKRFHLFDRVDQIGYVHQKGVAYPVGDYFDFLREFGWARMFTDHQDSPLLSAYPLRNSRRHLCEDGAYVGFGYCDSQSVYFSEKCILSGEASPVYSVSDLRASLISEGFSEWLRESYFLTKSKYSPRQWKRIIAGPKPFSDQELRVVDARRHYAWKLVGFAKDGDALFEVSNNSNMVLPYLTVGVRDVERRILIGSVWLDVSQVAVGTSAVIKKDCYKERIPPDYLDAYELPEPIPEKKKAYWEFGSG